MIAVILDSNILHHTPLWNDSALRNLLEYSNYGFLDILISDVVIKEVARNAEKRQRENLANVEKSIGKLSQNNDATYENILEILTEDISNKVKSKFNSLSEQNLISIVESRNDLLPELIDRAVHKIRPFTENKEEFRDAVIWLSCITKAPTTKYDSVYFISKNTTDFAKTSKDNASTELHEDLKKDAPHVVLLKSVKEILSIEKVNLDNLLADVPRKETQDWLDNQDFGEEWFQQLLNNDPKYRVTNELVSYFEHEDASRFFDNFGVGFIQSTHHDDVNVELGSLAANVDGRIVTIRGRASTFIEVEGYQYNPIHDSSDEKYMCVGEKILNIDFGFEYWVDTTSNESPLLSIEDIEVVEQLV